MRDEREQGRAGHRGSESITAVLHPSPDPRARPARYRPATQALTPDLDMMISAVYTRFRLDNAADAS